MPGRRLRWGWLGRVVLLLVLGVVVMLYVEHALSYFATRAQADQQQAIVGRLARQNVRLTQIQRSLNDPLTIVAAARRLGMVRPGELPYSVTGLR